LISKNLTKKKYKSDFSHKTSEREREREREREAGETQEPRNERVRVDEEEYPNEEKLQEE
jgi:hypothetical protein